MEHNKENLQGNPKPEGNISYFNSIEEKEKMCREMVGYNESLKESDKGDKNMYGKKKMKDGGRAQYKHGGGVHYYNSIEEKEKKCSEMVGYNESLKEKQK